ncbi:hypothetical protein [Pseudarthrobacter sp. ATCC 49987]|uniref:hypothetical protein n=1 Tax=Pseudarthrobacter sp. ATCC 49987 TaxID=2698204 RepID=UPI00136BC910|nr:hypothetical protein [Pseudarthrobacter sp. ATCC 49987]
MTVRHLYRHTAAAGLTLLTVAALLTGCTAGAPAGSGASTQPGTPAQSTAATPPAASSAPAAPARTVLQDSAPYKALTAEQQAKVSALEAMDVATFEKQSREDQLAYGAFLREVYQDSAITGTAGIAPDPRLRAARKVSSSDTGEQIVNDELLKAATARWSAQPDPGATATPADPGGNYAKMAPSRVSPLFPMAYAEVSAAAAASGRPSTSPLPDSTSMLLVAESNSFIPMDGTWEELPFKVVEMQNTETQARSQFWFAYTPFTDIHGVKDGVWILMFNAQESQDKWIPDLAVID